MSVGSGSSFAVLDGRTGWRTAWTRNVSAPGGGDLQLDGTGGGTQAFTNRPRWLTIDPGRNLFLLTTGGTIRRFEGCAGRFVDWLDTRCDGTAHNPSAIAANRREVAVLDPTAGHVRIYATASGALRDVVRPAGGWSPTAISADGDSFFVLTGDGSLFRQRAGSFDLARVAQLGAGTWSRLGLGPDGRVYALDEATSPPRLVVVDRDGTLLGSRTDGLAVGTAFPRLGITLITGDSFRIGDSGEVFGRDGEPVCRPPTSTLGPPAYAREGSWISASLDSEIYLCQWHRVEIEADVPPGTSLAVRTYCSDEDVPTTSIMVLDASDWRTNAVVVGPATADRPAEVLVRSQPARYLWLRIDLQSDGYRTPAVHSTRIEFPRHSWLRFLPGVYSSDDDSADFLARFLAIFQDEFEALEAKNDEVARLFDHRAVPDAFVDYIASWLAVPTEETWSAAQNRRLLATTRATYRQRGTPTSIRQNVRTFVSNLIGTEPPTDHLPQLIEGFRERRYREQCSPLGEERPLWSTGFVGRLQTDRYDQVGDVRLVSVGDPGLDRFAQHAHRFRVVLPAAWVKTKADAMMIRRAIEAERPAHTEYNLDLVQPTMRIGVQATLGLDTIVGSLPVIRLACSRRSPVEAEGHPVRLRGLGMLGGVTSAGPALVGRGIRLGTATAVV